MMKSSSSSRDRDACNYLLTDSTQKPYHCLALGRVEASWPVATTAAWTGGCEDIVPLASASEFCAGISDGLVSTVQLLLLLGLELRTT